MTWLSWYTPWQKHWEDTWLWTPKRDGCVYHPANLVFEWMNTCREITLFFQLGVEIVTFFIQPRQYLWLSEDKRLDKGCKLFYKFFALDIKDKFILYLTGLWQYIGSEAGTNVLDEHITSILTLKIEVVCPSNTMVHTYQATRCHNSEDHIWISNTRKISWSSN
jgi:hypothetical protein